MACGSGPLKDFEYSFFLQPDTSQAATCLDGCPVLHDFNAVCLYDSEHEIEYSNLPCYEAYLAKGFYNYYCLPADPVLRSSVAQFLQSREFFFTRIFGDIIRGWDVIGFGLLSSVSLATLSVLCVQYRKSRVLIGVIALAIVLAFPPCIGYFLQVESQRIADRYCDDFGPVRMVDCEESGDFLPVIIVVDIVLAGLAVVFSAQTPKLLRCRVTLQLAVFPIQDVARAVLVPLFGATISVATLTAAIAAAVHLASIAEVAEVTDETIAGALRKDVTFDLWARMLLFPLLFSTLWWLASISFWVEFMSSSIAHQWYFAKDRKNTVSAVTTAFHHSLSHLGSLAFAAFSQPLALFPRNCLNGVKSCVDKIRNRDRMRCKRLWQSCLNRYEKSLKFRVEQSVSYQALWGEAYTPACRKSYYLVERGQAEKLLEATHFGIWMIELCILMIAPAVSYYVVLFRKETFQGAKTTFITSALGLSMLCALFAWCVGSVVRGFLRGSVHGVLLSHLCEREMFPGIHRSENQEIADIVDQMAYSSAVVIAEESLKPTGFDLHCEPYKEKRQSSRIDALDESIAFTSSKDRKMPLGDPDDLCQTGIDFNETTVITEGDGRPWTPANRLKPIIAMKNAAVMQETSPERSLPVEDVRPSFMHRDTNNGEEDEPMPDFTPYRFVDLIKEKKDKEDVKGRIKTKGNRVVPERTVSPSKHRLELPEKIKVPSPVRRSKVL